MIVKFTLGPQLYVRVCECVSLLYVDNGGMCLYNVILNTIFCNFTAQLKSRALGVETQNLKLIYLAYFLFREIFHFNTTLENTNKPSNINFLLPQQTTWLHI